MDRHVAKIRGVIKERELLCSRYSYHIIESVFQGDENKGLHM